MAKQVLFLAAFVFLYAGAWAQASTTIASASGDALHLEVRGVDDASVNATPVERISPNGKQLYCAYDIDITKDGHEWQPEPEQPAMVTMENPDFADGQMLDIYHEGANGLEFVATVASENGKITFPAHSFSVYIVAQAGDYARLKVNLHRADGSIVTIYVKKQDITDGNFNRVVYNPGMGMPSEGVYCRGWTDNSDYDVADVSSAVTFDDIRTIIANTLTAGVTDGTELDFYTMLFKSYVVSYMDEFSAIVGTDELLYRADLRSPRKEYTVNAAYTPRLNTQHFEGWKVNTGGTNIEGYESNEQNYINSTRITISGDVFFSVNVSTGHWLVYHENGKGATYKAADFVRSEERTVEPTLDMVRNGYRFEGWYTVAPEHEGENPSGARFEFGHELVDDQHVYAKWSKNATANYTIIIWKQNVAGDNYDFEEVISLNGNVGSNIASVSAQNGTGNNNSYAKVNGTNKKYTGFHLERFDQNVNINPEGNSVLNVYYDRNQYKLIFQEQSSGGTVYKTIEALYQQPIGQNFPITDNGASANWRWMPKTNSAGFTNVLVYIDIMPAGDVTFYKDKANNTTKYMHYYVETISGQSSDRTYNGKGFTEYKTISANYRFFTEAEDYIDLVGFSKSNSYPPQAYKANNTTQVNQVWSNSDAIHIYCYYLRNYYTINFMDGTYYDGNGNPIANEVNHGQWGTVSNIAYGADVRSYNGNTTAIGRAPAGYVFESWCADKLCTQPFDFTTMPEGGITVYAKWRQIQYRVFLHPNAGTDPTLDWGSDSQEMNFRISYGGKVSIPTGRRGEDYDFVGWYTDAACTQPFNENEVLTETTVTTPYNKESDYTDPMDQWGNCGDNPYCSDAGRFWITKKYDIYGKWRAVLRGADGIIVEYDGNGGSPSTYIDQYLYQDNVEVIASDGCSYNDVRKEFSYWVLQQYNTSTGIFEDIPNSHILPGDPFTVLKSHTQRLITAWYNPNTMDTYDGIVDPNSLTPPDNTHTEFRANYIVKLRAEYVEDIQKPTYTFIQWFRNDGSDVRIDGTSASNPTLAINDAVLPPVPTRTGYNFKGWYKQRVASGEVPTTVAVCTPNFLYYNNGAYYKESTYDNMVTGVAADNYSPIDYLYAMWEPIVDFSFEPLCPGDQITLPTENSAHVDILGIWKSVKGSVSGTTYTAPGINDRISFTPNPSTCAQEASFDITVNTPNIDGASSYDYIWKGVSADWNTSSNWYVYDNGYSIAGDLPTTEHNVYIGPATQCVTSDNWPETSVAEARDVTIEAGATLKVPAGKTLNIAGDLNNIGSLNATAGTVVFCGTSERGEAQRISHDIVFGNVTFNNRGGDILPSGSIAVKGTANFENGIVRSDAVFESSSKAVAESHNSFVAGKVIKRVGSEAAENDFLFPTGSAADQQPQVLGSIRVATLAKNSETIVIFHNKSKNGVGFTIDEYPRWWNINDMCSGNDPQFDHVSNFEYWNVNTSSELSATLTVSAAEANAHFNANTSSYNGSDIYGAYWNGSCWENIGGSASTVASPYGTISVNVSIPMTRAAGDKIITLGSRNHNTVLPIELTSFTATCDGHSTLLEWTTATEKNNDYFSLERSDDAINFTEIARIAGAGNSIVSLDYSYTDFGVHGGDNYYRLVQVDYDGTRTASEIIVANCVETSAAEPEVVAYPNPFDSDLTVELENFGDRPARIDVYDVLGRLVYTEEVAAPQNDYQTVLHLGGLSDATYTVRVATSDFVINRKVVKQQ